MRKVFLLSACAALILIAQTTLAQTTESKQNEEKTLSYKENNKEHLQEWQSSRFGMFIHWGPVSLTGKEISWSRGGAVPISKYDSLYLRFNPVKFNADEWVSVAKAAGMKYVVLTTKHHDGFCLWDTHQTDYNIMNTPFKRDIVKELSEACRKQGLKFGAYYSTCDWYNPYFPNTGRAGHKKRKDGNLDAYTNYLKRQIAELMLNYGPLEVLWFDVPQLFDEKRGQSVIDFAHQIQPDIIINDRTRAPGDFDTPEQRIGGFQNKRMWETNITIADQWSWKPNDHAKTLQQCIQSLIRTVGGNGNMLLNVGPSPEGIIEPDQVQRLKEMGDWLKKNGVSVYDTHGGPYKPADWGVSTYKDSTIYVHVLAWQGKQPTLTLPDLGLKMISCKMLDGRKVQVRKAAGNFIITLPKGGIDTIDNIVEMKMSESLNDVKVVEVPSQSLSYHKNVTASSEPNKTWNGVRSVMNGDWAAMSWTPDEKDSQPWVEIDLGAKANVTKAIIYEKGNSISEFEVQAWNGSAWKAIGTGTTVGARKELNLKKTKTDKVRFVITKKNKTPRIYEIIIL